jgi:hypothetical protein
MGSLIGIANPRRAHAAAAARGAGPWDRASSPRCVVAETERRGHLQHSKVLPRHRRGGVGPGGRQRMLLYLECAHHNSLAIVVPEMMAKRT